MSGSVKTVMADTPAISKPFEDCPTLHSLDSFCICLGSEALYG